MPVYSYQALKADGQSCAGVIDADTARSARSLLRSQGMVPLSVDALQSANESSIGNGFGNRLGHKRVLGASALAIWTRQLAGLVASGLPLERALTSLTDEASSHAERNLVASIRSEVNSGSSLERALAQHPLEFNNIYRAVIGAGEQSGNLGLVLERLADDLEDQLNLRAKLLGAALYPMIVSGIAFVIVMFLLGYVVPQVANVFAGSHRSLPLLTIIMLALGNFVRNQWYLIAAAIALSVFGFRFALKNPATRLRFDAFVLGVPIVGSLVRGYNAARFGSTLSMMSAAGVPILQGLQAATQTLSNRALQSDAEEAIILVREGAPLASALAHKKRFPSLLPMFARLGEQTGELPVMLERAAAQLKNEVQRKAMQLASVLEPLLIVTMGLVVMLIVLAVLLPIIELNQLVH